MPADDNGVLLRRTGITDVMRTHHDHCRLCDGPEARTREGRLGRYRLTCDECEERRGSHLVQTAGGYASRAVHAPTPSFAA
ncbi:MAG: hypothetical protein R2695_02080 [Acidimicrobiales bacterium]